MKPLTENDGEWDSEFTVGRPKLPAEALIPAEASTPAADEADDEADGEDAADQPPAVADAPPAPPEASAPAPTPRLVRPPLLNRLRMMQQRILAANGVVNPAPKIDPRCPIMSRVASEGSIRSAVKAANAARDKLKQVSAELRPLLDPRSYAEEIITKIGSSTDADEISRLRDEYARFTGPAAEASRQAAIRIQRRQAIEFGRTLAALADAAEAELNSINEQIRKAESKLFRGFGFSHEPTGLTRRVEAIRAKLKNHREAASPSRHHNMTGDSALLDMFA